MGELIALEHVRRSKRLFGILIERYGLHYFWCKTGARILWLWTPTVLSRRLIWRVCGWSFKQRRFLPIAP